MKIIYCSIITSFLLIACTPAKMAIDDAAWKQKEELSVKGRNGFLINQKLTFGEFKTTDVQRSWTKGSSWGIGIGVNDWVDRLNVDFVRRKQTVRFNLTDESGNESQVTAFSKVKLTELSIGNSPGAVFHNMGNAFSMSFEGANTYAVRIATVKESSSNWDMIIDNNAVQRNAKTYSGLLAKSKSEYYTISPVYKMINKKGEAVSLPLNGSVGFEFRNKFGEAIAAVSLIDNGVVYFSNLSKREKFLLANAAAALLLQELLSS